MHVGNQMNTAAVICHPQKLQLHPGNLCRLKKEQNVQDR